MQTIQRLTLPEIDLCTDEALYFFKSEKTRYSYSELAFFIPKNDWLDFFSYFNAFNIQKWGGNANEIPLSAAIFGTGQILIQWIHHESDSLSHIICEQRLEISEIGTVTQIGISASPHSKGYISPRIYALNEDVKLTHLNYTTTVEPLHDVKLGIVITHFKREKQATGAVKRLNSGLLTDGVFNTLCQLFLVDNSQTLPNFNTPNTTVIKNKNYGGAGGFARGLLHSSQLRTITHCLFMDDDASCHVESIKRTINFLQYSIDKRTAICGAMLYEKTPRIQHENGARFRNGCIPLGIGLNLTNRQHLFINNALPTPDYGAWWYFAFPIAETKYYPFPFFVRGDDISFSLANEFNLQTINGVCSWQETFEGKASPLTTYLDTRNHLVHFLSDKTPGSFIDALSTNRQFLSSRSNSQLYESAQASLTAFEDVMKGPEFWKVDLDMSKKRTEILEKTKIEKLKPISIFDIPKLKQPKTKTKKVLRFLRKLSMNGLLIPSPFFKRSTICQAKGFCVNKDTTFRFKNILHYHEESKSGFVTTYSKVKQVSLAIRWYILALKFIISYRSLKMAYRTSYKDLASKNFWENQYGITKGNT